jgi:hypothetical protein
MCVCMYVCMCAMYVCVYACMYRYLRQLKIGDKNQLSAPLPVRDVLSCCGAKDPTQLFIHYTGMYVIYTVGVDIDIDIGVDIGVDIDRDLGAVR